MIAEHLLVVFPSLDFRVITEKNSSGYYNFVSYCEKTNDCNAKGF